MRQQIIELKPVRENPTDYDAIEKEIREVLRKKIYLPIMRVLTGKSEVTPLANASDNDGPTTGYLSRALRKGYITFSRGVFSGRLSAKVSKELRALGAVWDKKTKTYRLLKSQLPANVIDAAELGTGAYLKRLAKADEELRKILPAEVADAVKLADKFDKTIFEVDGAIRASFGKLAIQPTLTAAERKIIAEEWEENARLYIRNFTKSETAKLRAMIKANALKGLRFEHAIASIQKSYGVSERKAKFLAKQETSLLMSNLKKARYTGAGSNEYRWRCVAGSPKHPVRPSHKKLDGTIQRWDAPPITTGPNQPVRRCAPGEDFECRCTAIPIVRF